MSAVGTLVFCSDCGNLLDNTSGNTELSCEQCGNITKDTSTSTSTSTSPPTAFPSTLRTKKSSVQTLSASDIDAEATIQQTCPKCGKEEMKFYTLQLRSADEGATVFYRCVGCGWKFNTNN